MYLIICQVRVLTEKLVRGAVIKENLDKAEGNRILLKQALRSKEEDAERASEDMKRQAERENKLCICCADAAKSWAMYPCGHREFCQACAQKIIEDRGHCPVCREEAVGCNRIFL